MMRGVLALLGILLAGAAHAQVAQYGPGPAPVPFIGNTYTNSQLIINGTGGQQVVNLHGGILTGTVAGPFNDNFLTMTLNGTVSGGAAGSGNCACVRPLDAVLTINANAQWVEAYGFGAGVATTADATTPFGGNDIVGASSGVTQAYFWDNSRLYGGSTGATLGPSANDSVLGAAARGMYGYETDNFLSIAYTTTGTGGTETIATGTPYRSGYNSLAGGNHTAGVIDAAYTVQCGTSDTGGCWGNVIALVTLAGMPQGMPSPGAGQHPIQATGSFFLSESAQTFGTFFSLSNVTMTNFVTAANFSIAGNGRTVFASGRFNNSIAPGNMNANAVEIGLGNGTDTTAGDCGYDASVAKCLDAYWSPGDGVGANVKKYEIPLYDPTLPHGSIPAASQLITASQTVTLPTGWHSVQYWATGGGGGGGCGYVVTSGTAISGGGSGASSTRKAGIILATQYPAVNSLVLVIGTAGTGCTPSGTTNGSSGSGQTGGGDTTLTINSVLVDTAWHGGAGGNGGLTASAGGGSGGNLGGGGNASGATGGTLGAGGGITGGSGAAGTAGASAWLGSAGSGAALGGVGLVTQPGLGAPAGASGAGLAATPVALVGGNGGRAAPFSVTVANPGAITCNGTSQNGQNGSVAWANPNGTDLTGAAGGSGASCTTSAGGNAGTTSGFGAGGSGGGSTLATFLAGSGAAGAPGGVVLIVN